MDAEYKYIKTPDEPGFSMIVVAFTSKDEASAGKLVKGLLEKRLIACANLFPVHSMYLWHEKVVDDTEVLAFCKTEDGKYLEIKEYIEKHHEYDIPLVESWKIDHINEKYINWLREEVS